MSFRDCSGVLSDDERPESTMALSTTTLETMESGWTDDGDAIVARALRRNFKGGIEAVRGIDLTVQAGEVFGFLGPNGAGKTTTVRMLCTLLPPTSGSATVAGLDVVSDAAASGAGSASRSRRSASTRCRPAASCSSSSAGSTGSPAAAGRQRAKELLELVGLTEAADRRTKTYSGGMKRRLDLASALVHAPDVLFLDEPTTGLDPASRLTIWDEVRRINDGGATVFLTTQYLEEADKLCDRLAIIDDGRIVAEGTPEQLKADMGHDVVSVSLERRRSPRPPRRRWPACPDSSGSSPSPMRWRCTSRTAPARSPRSSAGSIATRSRSARSASRGRHSTTCS